MAITITMPALSPTMEEGALAKWLVGEGDDVSAGDVLAEVETDKAVMEIEAIDDGIVARLLVPAGTSGVKINTPIALLAESGEDPDSIEVLTPAGEEEMAAASAGAGAPAPPAGDAVTPEPERHRQRSDARGVDGPVRISPLARRVASERGIDISVLRGTGPHGRVIMRDLSGVVPALAAGVGGVGGGEAEGLDSHLYPSDSYDLEPQSAMGRRIAERLTVSATTIPQYSLRRTLCLDALLAARRSINDAGGLEVKISVTDMLVKAAALALIRVPECNVSYVAGGRVARHRGAHVSVAVALADGGLMTPVVRDAHVLNLAQISAMLRDLVVRARARALAPEEYGGGTFSLSNLGMYGVESFTSILNPPEAMILSVGAGTTRAGIDERANFISAVKMDVTLTSDHRVVSGAQAAQWLASFAGMVEHPATMLV